MKVSVLLKSFNYAPYLPAAIESALAQDAPFPWEIVLSDDCSEDACPAIVRDYAQRFPEKIRVLERTARVGMVRNTMETFAACRGEYVAWLDGDDYWIATDKLRRQAEFLDRHPEFVGCCTGVGLLAADGQTWHLDPPTPQVWRLEDIVHRCQIRTCSVMFRRAAVEFPPGFERLPFSDIPIYLLAARHGAFHYDPEVTAIYRLQGQGNSFARMQATRDSWARLTVDLLEEMRGQFDSREFRLGLAGHYLRFFRDGLAGRVDRRRVVPYFFKALRSVPLECGWVLGREASRRVLRLFG